MPREVPCKLSPVMQATKLHVQQPPRSQFSTSVVYGSLITSGNDIDVAPGIGRSIYVEKVLGHRWRWVHRFCCRSTPR